ncbi:ankyrin repeat domain-containing protein [bacterium]|nr:ankyrin repeat domain-containing protein [candidate division CSSED10-310 bacterium]
MKKMRAFVILYGLPGILPVIFLSACVPKLHRISEESCPYGLPDNVIRIFTGEHEFQNVFFDKYLQASIMQNRHDDLFLLRPGWLSSRRYHWQTYIKHDVISLMYETEDRWLIRIQSCHDWTEHFTKTCKDWWVILDRKSGRIIRTFEPDGWIRRMHVVDQVVYFEVETDNGIPAMICLPIEDKQLSEIHQDSLLRAIERRRSSEALRYIADGADVNIKRYDGNTALHLSVAAGLPEVVTCLCNAGADVTALNAEGRQPLVYAVINQYADIARTLLESGADPNAYDNYPKDRSRCPAFRTLLMYTISNNDASGFKVLLNHGADVTKPSYDGNTPLHIAAEENRMKMADTLIERGAAVDIGNIRGETPLHLAAARNALAVARRLIQHSARVNMAADNGDMPLHVAARCGHLKMVMLLVDSGADCHATNDLKQTPYAAALFWNRPDIERYLSGKTSKPASP